MDSPPVPFPSVKSPPWERISTQAAGATHLRFAAGTYLNHELLNDTVEDGAFVVKGLSRLALALLACAKGAKVFRRLGHEVRVEFHGDAPSGLAANGNVKKDTGPCGFVGRFGHFGVCCGRCCVCFGVGWGNDVGPRSL